MHRKQGFRRKCKADLLRQIQVPTSVWEKKSPGNLSRKDAREKEDFFWMDITFKQTKRLVNNYCCSQIWRETIKLVTDENKLNRSMGPEEGRKIFIELYIIGFIKFQEVAASEFLLNFKSNILWD